MFLIIYFTLLNTYLISESEKSIRDNAIKFIAKGFTHTCALTQANKMKCWGKNNSGQLGLGDTAFHGTTLSSMGDNLKEVEFGKDLIPVQIAADDSLTCAILQDKNNKRGIKCWGANSQGELGQEDTTSRGNTGNSMGDTLPFIKLGTNTTPIDISVGNLFGCAILQQNNKNIVKCWGRNNSGQLGLGDTLSYGTTQNQMGDNLKEVNLGVNVMPLQISSGESHTCVLFKKDNKNGIKCWGLNNNGQLGQEDSTLRGVKVEDMGDNLIPINLGTDITPLFVSAGDDFSCALALQKQKHIIKCWGVSGSGQLGVGEKFPLGDENNEMGDNLRAVDLGENVKPLSISTGQFHACALVEYNKTKKIKCWGGNRSGQLGLGNSQNLSGTNNMGVTILPFDIPFVDVGLPAVQVITGGSHTCALTINNLVKCWGNNSSGQLGLGHTMSIGIQKNQMGNNLGFVELFG